MTTLTPTRIAFEQILIPTDFTDMSSCAMEFAKSIAKRFESQLLVMHVHRLVNPITPPEAEWIREEDIQRKLDTQLEQYREGLRSEGFKARVISSTGAARDEILSAVEEYKVDLIVMGTHSKTGVKRLLFGSDAEDILRHVECPVITIGPPASGSEWRWPPTNIACAFTLEPGSAPIAAYAYSLAQQLRSGLCMFNIENPARKVANGDWVEFEREFRHNLPTNVNAKEAFQYLISDEVPGHKIAEIAKQTRISLS